jgi:DNA-binding transcriptional regulator YiaG
MLANLIKSEDIQGLTMAEAGSFAERLLSAERLKNEFDEGLRRKAFAEFLGIGESTLSVWLQSGRVPRMAALSYVLLVATQILAGKLKRREEAAADPVIVQTAPDAFAIVEPASHNRGAEISRVVGTAFDLAWARSFAAARSSEVANTLENARELLAERSEYEGDFLDEAASGVENVARKLAEGWCEPTLEELFDESVGDDGRHASLPRSHRGASDAASL